MLDPLFAAFGMDRLAYALPLLVAVSMVYAATRHEYIGPILSHAARFAGWVCVFMLLIVLVLYLIAG